MTTTNQTLEALGLSYPVYDNFREAKFQEWCRKWCREKAMSLRAMVKHDGLRNWYQDQWLTLVEKTFLHDHADYLELDAPGALQELFFEYPERILAFHPGPLMEIIKNESHVLRQRPVQV